VRAGGGGGGRWCGEAERRRSVASGDALAGETRSRVPGHGLARSLHLDVAGDATNFTSGSTQAQRRRRRREA
jgi:hypothetical protein